MKFMLRKDRVEGDLYSHEAIIIFGRSTLLTGKKDGWYIKLQTPFTLLKDYVDPNDFIKKTGQCRKLWHWRYRPGNKLIHVSLWAPDELL